MALSHRHNKHTLTSELALSPAELPYIVDPSEICARGNHEHR